MTKHEILAIAHCCRNSAVMLQVADGDNQTDEKRAKFREYNESQAGLLIKAADALAQLASSCPEKDDRYTLVWSYRLRA